MKNRVKRASVEQPVQPVQNQNLSASDVASSLLAIASLSQLQSFPAAIQQIPALSMCNYSDVTSMPTLSPDESLSDEPVVKRRKGVNFM